MADRDRFELEFGEALRAYAEEAPTQVRPTELARQFATAYPHGRTAIGRWGLVAVPRRAWALLLLAALLAAMVGGLAYVGSQRDRELAAVVPAVGQVSECPPGSTPDKPGPVDQARPPEDDTWIAFDRRAGRLVAITSVGDGVETWTFDVCTNTWSQMHPDREPPGFGQAELVYDIDSDVTVATLWDLQPVRTSPDPRIETTVEVWAYDFEADTWTEKGVPPVDRMLLAYDPVSGLIVATEVLDQEVVTWTYDVESDTWTPIHQANAGPSGANATAYDASVDRLVAYGDGPGGSSPYETWLFDLRSGSWSRSVAEGPAVVGWLVAPTMAYDEAAEQTAVFRRVPLTAYDATLDRWLIVPEVNAGWPHPGWPYPSRMVFDPVNRRLIGMSEWRGTPDIDVPPGGVEALELMSGKRTVLLEPNDGLPSH